MELACVLIHAYAHHDCVMHGLRLRPSLRSHLIAVAAASCCPEIHETPASLAQHCLGIPNQGRGSSSPLRSHDDDEVEALGAAVVCRVAQVRREAEVARHQLDCHEVDRRRQARHRTRHAAQCLHKLQPGSRAGQGRSYRAAEAFAERQQQHRALPSTQAKQMPITCHAVGIVSHR